MYMSYHVDKKGYYGEFGGAYVPEILYGTLEALREAGLRVPEDVLVVGTDDSLWARSAVPPLTTVRIDARHMGSQAMRLLLKRIASPDAPFARVVLAPELVVRGSSGPR